LNAAFCTSFVNLFVKNPAITFKQSAMNPSSKVGVYEIAQTAEHCSLFVGGTASVPSD
jgi:hypothetical protein